MHNSNSKNPVCLVTGGSSGIGLATAIRFAREGYDVAICGRRADTLQVAESQIAAAGSSSTNVCFSQVTDLNDVEQTKQLGQDVLRRFGAIDVLVNNAATAPLSTFEEISATTFETAINTNIRSVFYLTQMVWTEMKTRAANEHQPTGTNEQGRATSNGVVVNISSLAAVDPFPGFSLYGACKSWLELMSLALAAEGLDWGLRICSVRPGAVETPLLRNLFPEFPADQAVAPERVAETIWKCVAEPDRYPSGQAFEVSA